MRPYALVALVALVLSMLTSCRAVQIQKASKELNDKITPLIGAPQKVVLMKLGAPTSRDTVAGVEVWRYYRSYGVQSSAYAVSGKYSASGFGNTYETYDTYNLYFEDGLLVKWDGYVQR